MSSDYYGSIAGEQADRAAAAEAAFTEWVDGWARREAGPTYLDDLRAAFMAGVEAAAAHPGPLLPAGEWTGEQVTEFLKWWTEITAKHQVRWLPAGTPAAGLEACPDCSGKGGTPYTGPCTSCLGMGELPSAERQVD